MWAVPWALSVIAGLTLGVVTTRPRRPRAVESDVDRAVSDFYDRIRRGKCVVMFTATWCGPCKLAGPLMNSIQESGDYPKMDFMKIDIATEEGKVICAEYGIRGLPTFMFFNEGAPFGTASMGARAATTLAEQVRQLDAAASPSLMLAGLEL
jgi:thioredoxin 1